MATYVLVPGFWLGAWAWREVTAALRAKGHEVYPMTLTGVADRDHLFGPEVDLETHTRDIVRLLEVEDLRDVLLVGHSGGGMPVTQAADRVPDRIARAVYVDSGPLPDGVAQFDSNPPEVREALRGLDAIPPADELPAAAKARATPHPMGAATDPVRRITHAPVPQALVACSMPLDAVRQMIADEHPYFATLAGADLYGLPGDHWPMVSQPGPLAAVLDSMG